MHWFREIGIFVWAVLWRWQGLATGGLVTAVIALVERLSKRQLSIKRYLIIFVGVYLLASFFLVWHDEFERATGLLAKLSQPPAAPPSVQVNVPPPQFIFNAPPTSKDAPFPCEYGMKFTQTEVIEGLGPSSFGQRVEFIPRHFEVHGDTHKLPIILFYADEKITGGIAQGVMKDQYTGDPLAAGIAIATGNTGLLVRDTGPAELWLGDEQKFLKARKVMVELHSTKRFRVLCVEQAVVTNRYITVPNAQ